MSYAEKVPIQDRPWLTVSEAAGLIGVTPNLLYMELNGNHDNKLIGYRRDGGRWMIKREDLDNWLMGRELRASY